MEDLQQLIEVADDPSAINALLLDDLLLMVDGLRTQMREGSIGVNQQQQLVQAIKLIRVLTAEKANDSSTNNVITNLVSSLPFNDWIYYRKIPTR